MVPRQTLDEDGDFEAKRTELQAYWEKKMDKLSLKRKFANVEVLMFYWNKVDQSYLDTLPEVEALQSVFEKHYHFNVTPSPLNPRAGEPNGHVTHPELLIRNVLTNFIMHYDTSETLLIIYYAGHGHRNTDDQTLLLSGGNISAGENRKGNNIIAWQGVGKLIRYIEKAHCLLIFDCCHAALFENPQYRGGSGGKTIRNVEFLAACGVNEYAKAPGPTSFTHALTETLKEMAKSSGGFTLSQLCDNTRNYRTFPRTEQTPCPFSWTECGERLVIAPLLGNVSPDGQSNSQQDDGDWSVDPGYCLSLEFHMTELPTTDDLDKLCERLKLVARDGGYTMPARIGWGSLMHTRAYKTRKYVQLWKNAVQHPGSRSAPYPTPNGQTSAATPTGAPRKRRRRH